MYTLSNRLKIFSVALMFLGAIGWFYSYSNSHISLEEVKTMLAEEASHGGGHGEELDSHAVVTESHGTSDNHTPKCHIMMMWIYTTRIMLSMLCTRFTTDLIQRCMWLHSFL